MFLCYVDESGNTGENLADKNQPIHFQGGVIIHNTKWKACNADLHELVSGVAKQLRAGAPERIRADVHARNKWAKALNANMHKSARKALTDDQVVEQVSSVKWTLEIHAAELLQGGGMFIGTDEVFRQKVASDLLTIYEKYDCAFVGSKLYKAKHAAKYRAPLPPGHLTMMCLLERFEIFLKKHQENGLVICDEDADQSEHKLKLTRYQQAGTPWFGRKIERVIDSMHFVDSKTSYLVQLADVATYLFAHATLAQFKSDDQNARGRWASEWDRIAKRDGRIDVARFN